MKRTAMVMSIVTFFALAVYAFGPTLIANETDVASSSCSNPEGTGSFKWQVLPRPGWVCTAPGEPDRYLAWSSTR